MRFCLFCSARANSAEDAWPKWITNQFKGQRPAALQAERNGVPLQPWLVHQPTLKIRCVCESCNNGWMSRLEGRVKPYLQPLLIGESAVLEADAQTAIATWAVKTSMVLEGMDPSEKSGYSQLQRERFRLRAAMPWRTSVWLAAAASPDWFMSTKNRHLGEAPEDISGVSITMAFAHVVLQVLTLRAPEYVGPDTEVTTAVRQGQWSELTIQIWPPRDGARWPPPLGFNGEIGLNALAERFSTVGRSPNEIEAMAV